MWVKSLKKGGGGRGEVPGGLSQFQLSHEEAAASGPGPVLLWGAGGENKMGELQAWPGLGQDILQEMEQSCQGKIDTVCWWQVVFYPLVPAYGILATENAPFFRLFTHISDLGFDRLQS